MTSEQRLDRAERILKRMAQEERRARIEWRHKFNTLIDARNKHEASWRAESAAINEQLKEVAVAHAEFKREMADLARSQKLTDKSLRAFIDSLRKGRNGKSSD